MTEKKFELVVREQRVTVDESGNVCLNDLWRLAGEPESKRSSDWKGGQRARDLILALCERIAENLGKSVKSVERTVFYTVGRGRPSKTYAHPVLALDYSEYLDRGLMIEIRELFLRYKANDVTLADEIMERWSAQHAAESARLEAREKLTDTEKRFSGTLFKHEVDGPGIGRVRSKGDETLFAGKDTQDMKTKWKVPKGRPLADFAPEVVIIAKQLGAAMTTHNVRVRNIRGEDAITDEHVANNDTVRDGLVSRGMTPENLDGEEDIKKVERRHAAEAKKLAAPKKKAS